MYHTFKRTENSEKCSFFLLPRSFSCCCLKEKDIGEYIVTLVLSNEFDAAHHLS